NIQALCQLGGAKITHVISMCYMCRAGWVIYDLVRIAAQLRLNPPADCAAHKFCANGAREAFRNKTRREPRLTAEASSPAPRTRARSGAPLGAPRAPPRGSCPGERAGDREC